MEGILAYLNVCALSSHLKAARWASLLQILWRIHVLFVYHTSKTQLNFRSFRLPPLR